METAFLSVRVPVDRRRRLKIVAAERGLAVQDLVNQLVETFLAEAERRPPMLADVIRTLRRMEGDLRSRGAASLSVFGSVARGEARVGSDIDLAIGFKPDARVSLFDIDDIRGAMEALLGHPVDLGERSALMPHAEAEAEAEAAINMIPVF